MKKAKKEVGTKEKNKPGGFAAYMQNEEEQRMKNKNDKPVAIKEEQPAKTEEEKPLAMKTKEEQPVKTKEEVKTNEEASDGQLVQDFK